MSEKALICTVCESRYPFRTSFSRCPKCNEPLELEAIGTGSIKAEAYFNIFRRYGEFFPFREPYDELDLGEGMTPLVWTPALAKKYGIGAVAFKNETANPTWSFKDRGTATALRHAKILGFSRIGTVSTGNMAASVAAFGAKTGVETTILVSSDIPSEKLNPIAIYHPRLIRVHGDYSRLYSESLRLGEELGIYFMNSDVPFRVEGSKTIAFEICEQTSFRVPDFVIVPTSAGGNIRGIEKGFREFYKVGLIARIPTIVCVQAEGCSPIVKAFEKKSLVVERFSNPHTIAHAIENPFPPSGNQVLRVLNKNSGVALAVSDEEILAAQKELAETGLFVQPASASSLAALKRLVHDGALKSNHCVVCVLTGSGLKYTSVFQHYHLAVEECDISQLKPCLSHSIS